MSDETVHVNKNNASVTDRGDLNGTPYTAQVSENTREETSRKLARQIDAARHRDTARQSLFLPLVCFWLLHCFVRDEEIISYNYEQNNNKEFYLIISRYYNPLNILFLITIN